MELTKPYYAVIFSNYQTDELDGYAETAALMEKLAAEQPGYLGFESARDGLGIAVSYWESLEAIAGWKQQTDHLLAQKMGKSKWYSKYKVRICRVEREYDFDW